MAVLTHRLVFRTGEATHTLSRHGSERAANKALARYANTARRSADREDIRPYLSVEPIRNDA